MKTDRGMLELAGRAIGYSWDEKGYDGGGNWWNGKSWLCNDWNPLTDDGDALRLAVSLKMRLWTDGTGVVAEVSALPTAYELAINNGGDIYAATRRAIVRAAEAIGEQMK